MNNKDKEELKAIAARLLHIVKENEADKPKCKQPPKGWYKADPTYDNKMKIYYDGELVSYNKITFGFNSFGDWIDKMGFACFPERFILMTKQEIKEALVKEAEKRGFKEGVRYKPILHFKDVGTIGKVTGHYIYCFDDDSLCAGYQYIYEKGQWAEIVKEQPIMIGGNSVDFIGSDVIINSKIFNRADFEFMKILLRTPNSGIMLFGQTVSIETINEILKRLS